MNPRKDYYAILGVLATAEDIVIRGAYRALAQRYHPDRFEGSPEEAAQRMAEINEAYGVLSDPAQREAYDRARDPFVGTGGSPAGGIDPNLVFEVEQFRTFAEKLHEWGYDEVTIRGVLAGRGVRPVVAEQLARMVSKPKG